MKKRIIAFLVATIALSTASSALANHEHGKEMWDKCDTNKDGFISRDEFMKSKDEHFKKADKNGDGKLSEEEHKEMMKEMKEKMHD